MAFGRRNKILMTAGTLALVGLLPLTGCTSNSSPDAPAAEDGGQATWIEADSALSGLLVDAGYTKPLIIATDVTIGYPWAAVHETTGVPDGLDMDLSYALGQVLGAEVTIENTSFDSLIPGLAADRYDFSVSVMIDSKVRQQQVDFVDFVMDASGFIVPIESDLDNLTLDDACGRTLGVVRSSVEEMYLTERSASCVTEGLSPVDLQVFQQLGEGVLAVTAGRIEALCGDKLQNAYLEALPNAKVKQSGGSIGETPVGMAIGKGSALVPILQKALQALIDDGAYLKILDKWGVADAALESATVNGGIS